MARFIDRVVLHLQAGDGGHGCVSVHREKFKPLGGPDGGNGGHGGDIILEVSEQIHTLMDFHYRPHIKAQRGGNGAGDMRNGGRGEDLILEVPAGTVVRTEKGETLADLTVPGTRFVAAEGGFGGLGNAALASKNRKAPGFALQGEPGQAHDLILELKSMADVGLVGFPSAGKSSLISVLSAAKPKIGDYPFTTLQPNLGVVNVGHESFTVADVPGLIEGASEGKGLGLEFLRHVERCSVLVHVIDCATLEPGRDPMSDLDTIEHELSEYVADESLGGKPLSERTRIVVLNKADVPDARELAEMVKPDLEARGLEVFIVSAVAHQGLKELTFALAKHVEQARQEVESAVPARVIVRPKAMDDAGFRIVKEGGTHGTLFRIVGDRPTRWVRQTDFSNDEAVGYLADRLNRLGIEEELFKAGAVPGSTVLIGPGDNAVVFDWEPTLQAGAELLGARGTDLRLEEASRPSRAEKRDEFHNRKDGQRLAREELAAERQAGVWTEHESYRTEE